MIEIFFFEHGDTSPRSVQSTAGTSVMKAAIAGDIEGVAADCGGTLTCATCHVMVREPWLSKLPPMTDDEDGMLDFAASARQPNSRLACQIHLSEDLQGMCIDLPPTQY